MPSLHAQDESGEFFEFEPEAVTPASVLSSLRDERRSARRWQELLSPQERRHLLADIARVALAIGQDLYPENSLSDLDIGGAGSGSDSTRDTNDTCPRERLAFLAAVWPRLSRALHRIEAAPDAVLRSGTWETQTAQGRLRRVSPQAVLAAVRGGDLLPAPADTAVLARRLGGHLPRRIAESVAVSSADTPANRAVKGILTQMARDTGGIILLAEDADSPDIARQAEDLHEALRRHLRHALWMPLTPASGQIHPPTARPAYRFVFEQWRRYRAAFAFDWTTPLFTLPARQTWLLYEYGCWFAAADALRGLGYRAVSADYFTAARSGLTFALVPGRASRLTFRKSGAAPVLLTYNPLYSRETPENSAGWHSRSHALRPDIAVESGGRLLLLDAKFKTYTKPVGAGSDPAWHFTDSALLPDIQQMHTYRDAIARGVRTGVVHGAWLLYAGRRNSANPGRVTYPRANEAQPFGAGEVGALLLRPGGDPAHGSLGDLLGWFLASAG